MTEIVVTPAPKEIKDGTKTSEFWGKSLVQLLTLIAMFIPAANIDPTVGIALVGAIEVAYNLGRSIVKALHERGKQPIVVVPKGG